MRSIVTYQLMPASIRAAVFGGTLAAVAVLAACGDPLRPVANVPNLHDTVTVYGTNSGIQGSPSALVLYAGATVRADAGFTYDVAFDFDASGNPLMYSVRKLAGLGGGHQVSFKALDGSFDSITEAPTSGYVRDTVVTLAVGKVFAIESANPSNCGVFDFSPFLYSKLTLTAFDAAAKTMTVAFATDRTCGFRQLTTGVPTR